MCCGVEKNGDWNRASVCPQGGVADVLNRISCCLPLGFFSAVFLQLGLSFLLAAVFVTLACQEAMTFPLPIFLCFFGACALY